MTSRVLDLIQSLARRSPAPEAAISAFMSESNVSLPQDYLDFMRVSNGAEGPSGKAAYLQLYPIEQILSLNEPYLAHGVKLLIFGSNGGGEEYAFDARSDSPRIVAADSVSMDLGPITFCGTSFLEFLEYLNAQ